MPMAKIIDMVGKRFGRLVVTARGKNSQDGKPQYVCICDCGNTCLVRGKLLRTGRTQSCSCYRYEQLNKALTKHGYCFTKTYQSWVGMKDRCLNPQSKFYKNYGGRGITVCDRWMKFENFLSDMGHRPKRKSLERIDVNRGYEPSNCCWATMRQQANNKRNTVRITYNGVTQTISAWADQLGIPRTTINVRYHKGLPPEQVLAPKRVVETILFKGRRMTWPEVAKAAGIPYVTLRHRLRQGMPLQKAIQKNRLPAQ